LLHHSFLRNAFITLTQGRGEMVFDGRTVKRYARLASELDRIVQELDQAGLNIAAAYAAQSAHAVRSVLDRPKAHPPVCKPDTN
jgi:hypothetical protein